MAQKGRIYRLHHLGGERVACRDAQCQAWEHGWRTVVDEATELGQAQAAYIRYKSGRRFQERKDLRGLTVFEFAAKQPCFTHHRVEYGVTQRRRKSEDFVTIPLDRFTGEWNEIVAGAR